MNSAITPDAIESRPAVTTGDRLRVYCRDLDVNGRGICRPLDAQGSMIEGLTLFVTNALPGETLVAEIDSVRKRLAEGHTVERLDSSPDRITPPCPLYGDCGGCNLQHLTYSAQLEAKRRQVVTALSRLGGFPLETLEPITAQTVPSPSEWAYRNNAQYPVAYENDRVQIGFYAAASHRIVDGTRCLIQDPAADLVRSLVRDFPRAAAVTQLLVRTAKNTPEVMVALLARNPDALAAAPELARLTEKLARALASQGKKLASFWLNQASERAATVPGRRWLHIYGAKTITETINGLRYEIAPPAFFQVNSEQTSRLYELAVETCGLSGRETVLDLYCGSGTISCALAREAARVIGIEVVVESIENARCNADANGLGRRCSFFLGEAEKVLPSLVRDGLQADVVLVDPPRKGCDPALLAAIKAIAPNRIVYVSCDPATLARDLKELKTDYDLVSVTPVDMFPQTMHVECVVLMSRAKE